MGISPLAFTGLSKFSDDFQAIVNRTVAIANLPVQRLQSDQATLLSKKTAMGNLRSTVASLASALSSLSGVAGSRAVSPASSSSKANVSVTGSPVAASYVISEITSLATAASATAKTGFSDTDTTPVAAGDHSLSLTVGASTHTIALDESSDNLQGVADAINAGNYGVRATIIDTGAASGQFFLALNASEAGPAAISLKPSGGGEETEILQQTSPGSNAEFKFNGQPVSSRTNSISSVVQGLAFTLNETTSGDETITISAQPSRNTLSVAMKTFVSAYNNLRDAVDAQSGEQAGSLSGDRIVYEVQSRMRSVVSVSGPDGLGSLAKLGLTLGSDGKMSFDDSTVQWMGDADLEAAFAFLGDTPGALGAIAADLDQLSDPITGLITYELSSYDLTDKRLSAQIETLSARVSATQSTLFAQLQAADALLAQLESQQNIIQASVESLNLVLFGKNDS
ncbi:MAG: flagellar filament capping protein FliD [Bryobacteraceae bacterium]|nr:flagellar filament capping protein FliD [Bryobacteraceae bacterium]